MSPPKFLMTERIHSTAVTALDLHIAQTRALPGFLPGSEPRYYLHPPGAHVHGTVIIFPGYSSNAGGTVIQSKILFKHHFNVIALNLPGSAQEPAYWPSTILRESAGYEQARQVLLSHAETKLIVQELQKAVTPGTSAAFFAKYSTTIISRLEKALSGNVFQSARRALYISNPERVGNAPPGEVWDLFDSQHTRYDADSFALLSLVSSLPGPRFGCGHSLGAPAVVNLASRSQSFSAIALFAPFFAQYQNSVARVGSQVTAFMGALDLYNRTLGAGTPVSANTLCTAIIVARLAARDEITRPIQLNTRTLCVIAKDDSAVEWEPSMQICHGKLNARTFVYPPGLGINHAVPPDSGNRYGISLVEQVVKFFLNTTINDKDFLVAKNTTV